MKKSLKTFANINILVGVLLMVLPIGVLIYLNFGHQEQVLAAFEPQKEDKILSTPIFEGTEKYTFKDPFGTEVTETKVIKDPPLAFNVTNSLSTTGATIQIEGLQLNTKIYESTNQEVGLSQGVWRDPKYGTPDTSEQPVVLAAHRWGQDDFSWDFRDKNLFTEFDKLRGGEIVTITWNNKVYKYVIVSLQTADHVNRTADLIMYTCVDYYSTQRIIVYANRIN